ncbi:D-arabitol-phosphate dehydrogenase [archaeon HR06]|nr:D-arabitol-phosphate dehydrogenase [archaeon HR06]
MKIIKGEKEVKSSIILGHEFSGDVVEGGKNVNYLSEGDRVAIYPIIACGHCYFCSLGKRNRCLKRKTMGIDVNGGFAQYALIPEEAVKLGHILKLPKDLSYEEGALVEPLATVLNSLETLNLSYGDSLLIIGSGPMGLMHVILGKRLSKMIIVSDPLEERLNLARSFGADITVKPEDLTKEIKNVTDGLGVDKVVVTVASSKAVEQALDCVKSQGKINLFAGGKGLISNLDLNKVHYKELTLLGTQNATFDQYKRSLALAPQLKLRNLITHEFLLEEYSKAFELKGDLKALKVILKP